MKLFITICLLVAAVAVSAAPYTATHPIAAHMKKRDSLGNHFNANFAGAYSATSNETDFKTISMKFKIPELDPSKSTKSSSTIIIGTSVSDHLQSTGTHLHCKLSNNGSVSYSWVIDVEHELPLELDFTAGDLIQTSMTNTESDQRVATLENLSRNETFTYTYPTQPSAFQKPLFASWLVYGDQRESILPPKFGSLGLTELKFETPSGTDWTDYEFAEFADLVFNNETVIKTYEVNKTALFLRWV